MDENTRAFKIETTEYFQSFRTYIACISVKAERSEVFDLDEDLHLHPNFRHTLIMTGLENALYASHDFKMVRLDEVTYDTEKSCLRAHAIIEKIDDDNPLDCSSLEAAIIKALENRKSGIKFRLDNRL